MKYNFTVEWIREDADLDCQDGKYGGGLLQRFDFEAKSWPELLEKIKPENTPNETGIILITKTST